MAYGVRLQNKPSTSILNTYEDQAPQRTPPKRPPPTPQRQGTTEPTSGIKPTAQKPMMKPVMKPMGKFVGKSMAKPTDGPPTPARKPEILGPKSVPSRKPPQLPSSPKPDILDFPQKPVPQPPSGLSQETTPDNKDNNNMPLENQPLSTSSENLYDPNLLPQRAIPARNGPVRIQPKPTARPNIKPAMTRKPSFGPKPARTQVASQESLPMASSPKLENNISNTPTIEITKLKTEINSLKERNQELERLEQTRNSKLVRFQKENEDLKKRNEQIQEKEQEAFTQIENLQNDLDKKEQQIQQLNTENVRFQTQVKQLQEAEEKNKRIEKTKTEQENLIEKLKSQLNNLQIENSGLKTQNQELIEQRDSALKRAAEVRKEKEEVWRQSVQAQNFKSSLENFNEEQNSNQTQQQNITTTTKAEQQSNKETTTTEQQNNKETTTTTEQQNNKETTTTTEQQNNKETTTTTEQQNNKETTTPEYPILCKAKAEYDYDAREDNELTFLEGDIINVIAKDPSGWWTGELKGVFGLFPDNFVFEIQGSGTAEPSHNIHTDQSINEEPAMNVIEFTGNEEVICRVKVIYDYSAQEENELTMKEDDIIEVIAQDEGWWTGRLHGEIGVFPDNFVEILPSSDTNTDVPPATKAPSPPHTSPTLTSHTSTHITSTQPLCYVRAEYDYDAQEDNELSFKEGDRVVVLEKDPSGWWTGELDGVVGLFPDNFVVEI